MTRKPLCLLVTVASVVLIVIFAGTTSVTSVAQTSPSATPQLIQTSSVSGLKVDTAANSVAMPKLVDFDTKYLTQLKLPTGFAISVFATGVGNSRMMAVSSDDTVYVTRPATNDVAAFSDNGSSVGTMRVVASNMEGVHGITIHDNHLYLAAVKQVLVADSQSDGTLTQLKVLINDLPDGAQHARRTIAFGPDGMMYISLGSSCNDCSETNKENAAIVRANADGTGLKVYAMGLRNTIGWGWQPAANQLWGMDGLGDDLPPEELNAIQESGNYGWPFRYGDKQVHRSPYQPKGTTKEAYCPITLGPTLTYQDHSAPIAMIFYTGTQFPAQYQGSAFVAMHGSWNRAKPTGYAVVHLTFNQGKPVAFEDFLTGFLINNTEVFGRPAGLVVAKDGSLLISDDTKGVIYRVSYKGA